MSTGTILFADNDPDFLDTRAELLERAGYRVLKAYTLEQARRFFADTYFHLAVLDIRMVDDDDDRDVSGLTLAKDPRYLSVPKIILTGFSTYQAVREALGPPVDGLPPAVDFLDKKEGAAALIEAVEGALARHVGMSWDLDIRWGQNDELRPPYLVSLVRPGLPRAHLADRTQELEDLLRKLFRQDDQLTLGRILAHRAGRVLLTAFAYPREGQEEQFVVALGERGIINEETARFESFAPDQGTMSLAAAVGTLRFGAAAYRLSGRLAEEVTAFKEFYHRRSTEDVLTSVENLFKVTLQAWYEKGRERQERPLESFCQERLRSQGRELSQAALEDRVRGICRESFEAGIDGLDCSSHDMTVSFSRERVLSYPNPAPYLYEARVAVSPPTLCGTTHGRLNAESVAVDQLGRSWLIDFGESGIGSLLCDFAAFESSVKFDVLEGLALAERHALEERLLTTSDLIGEIDLDGANAETAKALRVIGRIRAQAAAVAGSEAGPYMAALLYGAAERVMDYRPDLRYTRGEMTVFAHALLSMGMICRQLSSWDDPGRDLPRAARESLWIDGDNMEVWVEGRRVPLAGQGFRLLEYLYERANQLCRRSDLATDVFDVDLSGYHSAERKDLTKDTINTAVSRLRRDIEPNPGHPKYIETVRGAGYRLVLGDVSVDDGA